MRALQRLSSLSIYRKREKKTERKSEEWVCICSCSCVHLRCYQLLPETWYDEIMTV